jgi:recombination associated protein RdgC
VKLALSWNDRISFIFDQEFTLRRIKPLEVIDNLREENDDLDAEVLFVADMILFQAEVRGLIKRLLEILVVK